MVSLRFIRSQEDRDAIAALAISTQPFTTPPAVLLAKATTNQQLKIVAIEKDNQICGYFALETGPTVAEISPHVGDVMLRMLAIDKNFRRQGIAKTIFTHLLIPFVRQNYPNSRQIMLLVSEANWGAYRLYGSSGFRDTGFVRGGPWGRQRVLTRPVCDLVSLPGFVDDGE